MLESARQRRSRISATTEGNIAKVAPTSPLGEDRDLSSPVLPSAELTEFSQKSLCYVLSSEKSELLRESSYPVKRVSS